MNFIVCRTRYWVSLWLIVGVVAVLATSTVNAQILFQDGFESGNLTHTQNGIRWAPEGVRTSISSTQVRSGTRSLEFSFEAVPAGQDSFSEHRVTMTSRYTDLWIMYDLYIPANYYHRPESGANNKFFAIFRDPYPASGYSVNFSTYPNGSGGSHIEVHYFNNHAEEPYLTPESGRNFITSADAGRWHNIILHFKVPTGQGTNDGVMELWKNGSRIVNITNLASWGGSGTNYMDQAYLIGWANSGYAQQTDFYVDNFVISDTPLGVNPPGAPGTINVQ